MSRAEFLVLFCVFIVSGNCAKTYQSTRVISSDQDSFPHHGRCEPITIPLCIDIPYNETIMPNLLGHGKQDEAGLEVSMFFPLVKIKCSPDLQVFLCSVYVPVCTILEKPLPPCRSLCLSARNCERLMNKFGYSWPESLECSKFPEAGLCVGDNSTGNAAVEPNAGSSVAAGSGTDHTQPAGSTFTAFGPPRDLGFVCPEQFKTPPDYDYSLTVAGKTVTDCGAPCDSMFFDEQQRRLAKYWVGTWAVICVVSCLFTVVTFLLDTDRFRYPERPIIFLSVCYLMVAAAYVGGFAAGDTISCMEPFPPSVNIDRLQMVSVITQVCTIFSINFTDPTIN